MCRLIVHRDGGHRVRVHSSGSYQRFYGGDDTRWTSGIGGRLVPIEDGKYLAIPSEPGDYMLAAIPMPSPRPLPEPQTIALDGREIQVILDALAQWGAEFGDENETDEIIARFKTEGEK